MHRLIPIIFPLVQILAQELGPATNLSAIVNVTVFVVDANDNPPRFAESEYRVELPENVTAGTRVTQVHAEDVDTGMGGRIRYTQILGYLNTSLNLDAASGIITVSTNNHGFDREKMPEYHLYVEARDDDGIGNRAEVRNWWNFVLAALDPSNFRFFSSRASQVPLIIQLLDVNDETPTFEKSLYEFILTPDLKNFTVPAFIKATDADAEEPNNIVRYEIIHGNYENKFHLNEITGQLMLRESLMKRPKRQATKKEKPDTDVFVLTARAFDLGVPVRFSMTTVRIYPPESRARTVQFLVPGYSPDRKKLTESLSSMTGGRVIIQDVKPYTDNLNEVLSPGTTREEKSVVTATVIYDTDTVVDVAEIQKGLMQQNANSVVVHEDAVS